MAVRIVIIGRVKITVSIQMTTPVRKQKRLDTNMFIPIFQTYCFEKKLYTCIFCYKNPRRFSTNEATSFPKKSIQFYIKIVPDKSDVLLIFVILKSNPFRKLFIFH